MYEITIQDNDNKKVWTEPFYSYNIFRKRFMKLKHSSKLTMLVP